MTNRKHIKGFRINVGDCVGIDNCLLLSCCIQGTDLSVGSEEYQNDSPFLLFSKHSQSLLKFKI